MTPHPTRTPLDTRQTREERMKEERQAEKNRKATIRTGGNCKTLRKAHPHRGSNPRPRESLQYTFISTGKFGAVLGSARCTSTQPEPRLSFYVRMSLSNEEIEAGREAFARFDKDNSGAIDAWELRATLQCAPPPCAS